MEGNRLDFLRRAVESSPDDAFARYGLAMELARYGDPKEAWQHFEYLLAHHPQYSAAYYQAGMLLIKLGRIEEAREVLEQGVALTGRQGNRHAQSELQAALDELKDEL